MSAIRLDGRVAIVTGAGRGIGRAHARLLAERGCAVVVNDLGTDGEGKGNDPTVAQAVVQEIIEAGGQAVADCSDVGDPTDAETLVRTAIGEFGRIDAIINNAGIVYPRPFEEISLADCERVWRINFGGSFNVTQAAWPHFKNQQYGRVILTGSGAGTYGRAQTAAYGSAKGAIQGLARTLALEGEEYGILVNLITPGAFTRMAEAALTEPEALERARNQMHPDFVAPLAVWLASERCQVSGQTFTAYAGRVARVAFGTGRGFTNLNLTPEMIEENYSQIEGLNEFYEPKHVLDEVAHWLD